MRVAWTVALLGACAFTPGSSPRDAQGHAGTDGAIAHSDGASVPPDAAPDAPPDASPGTCVTHSTTTFNGHHYFQTSQNADWLGAQNECDHYGGHLVKITSQQEDQFVTDTFAQAGYTWIGLSDPLSTDVYVWTDGSLLAFGYNNFPDQQVPHSSNNCVDTNGTWDTYGCLFSSHPGTCECE